ncbi:MAG TPA: hypothetical protein VN364_00090 [Bellilinea sp.]|nr:hypothetical protein [Bellilinea sp.]
MNLAVLTHSLIYGGILSALMFLFIIGSMLYNPELWLNDYPPDVRQKYGPVSEQTLKTRKWFGIVMILIMAGVILATALTVPTVSGDKAPFLTTLRSAYIVFLIGSLMDLLVIDLLLGMVIRPKFMILKGTEGAAGYKDVKFHFNAFLRSAFSGAVLCLILTAIAQLILIFPG